jgi:hypothetical protein
MRRVDKVTASMSCTSACRFLPATPNPRWWSAGTGTCEEIGAVDGVTFLSPIPPNSPRTGQHRLLGTYFSPKIAGCGDSTRFGSYFALAATRRGHTSGP